MAEKSVSRRFEITRFLADEFRRAMPEMGATATAEISFSQSGCAREGCEGLVGVFWPVVIATKGSPAHGIASEIMLAYPCNQCGRLYEQPGGRPLETKDGLQVFKQGNQAVVKNSRGEVAATLWLGVVSGSETP